LALALLKGLFFIAALKRLNASSSADREAEAIAAIVALPSFLGSVSLTCPVIPGVTEEVRLTLRLSVLVAEFVLVADTGTEGEREEIAMLAPTRGVFTLTRAAGRVGCPAKPTTFFLGFFLRLLDGFVSEPKPRLFLRAAADTLEDTRLAAGSRMGCPCPLVLRTRFTAANGFSGLDLALLTLVLMTLLASGATCGFGSPADDNPTVFTGVLVGPQGISVRPETLVFLTLDMALALGLGLAGTKVAAAADRESEDIRTG